MPIDPLAIPLTLRQLRQWVGWRSIDGTKLPVVATTGQPASSTDPATWCDFSTAMMHAGKYDGIGFVFIAGGGLTGIDLDECISTDGIIHPEAELLLEDFNSYSEISPSGRGVKIWIRGEKPVPKCVSKPALGCSRIEIYDSKRFFTVTGRRYGQASEVADGQERLATLMVGLFPPSTPIKPPATPPAARTAALVPAQQRAWKYLQAMPDAVSGQGGHNVTIYAACVLYRFDLSDDDAWELLCRFNAEKCKPQWTEKELRHKLTDAAAKITGDDRGRLLRETQPAMERPAATAIDPRGNTPQSLPTVRLGTDESRVTDEIIHNLATDPNLFARGNVLVRVAGSKALSETDTIRRPENSPIIKLISAPNLRDRITRYMSFEKYDKRAAEWQAAHPPTWAVSAALERGEYPGIRELAGISDTPILRPDGSIAQTPGYDSATGVLYAGGADFPAVPDDISIDDAWAAAADLLSIISDFRFEAEEHKAAWLAALLTLLARHAFAGPAPLFLFDANIRGAGKGLGVQVISRIVFGREMAASGYVHDPDELRKRITAAAIAGDPSILFDNVEGPFGNDALDRALTSTFWQDRILGKSEQISLPLRATWYATGNNFSVEADTLRRVIHIRLDVLEEKPEERSDFEHPDLLGWVMENRSRFLVAGLTILAAYIRAGKPSQSLKPFGSFEGWSNLVRSAVVWCGLPDPNLTLVRLAETSDTSGDTLAQLMHAWSDYDKSGSGLIASELLDTLWRLDFRPSDSESVAMRAAIESVIGLPPGKVPSARQLSRKLRGFRRRVMGSRYFDFADDRTKNGNIWRLVHMVFDKNLSNTNVSEGGQ